MTSKKLIELSEKAVDLFTGKFEGEYISDIATAVIFGLAYMNSLQAGEHIMPETIVAKALANLYSLEGDSHGNLKNS